MTMVRRHEIVVAARSLLGFIEARRFVAGWCELRKDFRAAKRFGLPGEFADACAFLCSAQAGFISGQNLQLDGGSYHGLI